MVRSKHPNKDIEKALQYAEKYGWSVEKKAGSSHAWGIMKCPENSPLCRGALFCLKSIWCTPKNPHGFAKEIRRIVDGCQFLINGNNNEDL